MGDENGNPAKFAGSSDRSFSAILTLILAPFVSHLLLKEVDPRTG